MRRKRLDGPHRLRNRSRARANKRGMVWHASAQTEQQRAVRSVAPMGSPNVAITHVASATAMEKSFAAQQARPIVRVNAATGTAVRRTTVREIPSATQTRTPASAFRIATGRPAVTMAVANNAATAPMGKSVGTETAAALPDISAPTMPASSAVKRPIAPRISAAMSIAGLVCQEPVAITADSARAGSVAHRTVMSLVIASNAARPGIWAQMHAVPQCRAARAMHATSSSEMSASAG